MSAIQNNKILVFFFTAGFIAFNVWVKWVSGEILSQKDCPCAANWQVEQVNTIATVGLVVGAINIFIPITRTLYNIPIISTVFTALIVIILLMYVFGLSRMAKDLGEDKCRTSCRVPSSALVAKIGSMETFNLLVLGAGLGIGLLYF
jgi:uncharacterized protein YacL